MLIKNALPIHLKAHKSPKVYVRWTMHLYFTVRELRKREGEILWGGTIVRRITGFQMEAQVLLQASALLCCLPKWKWGGAHPGVKRKGNSSGKPLQVSGVSKIKVTGLSGMEGGLLLNTRALLSCLEKITHKLRRWTAVYERPVTKNWEVWIHSENHCYIRVLEER